MLWMLLWTQYSSIRVTVLAGWTHASQLIRNNKNNSHIHRGFTSCPIHQTLGYFREINACLPASQMYKVMNILIRSELVAGQDLAQRTPRGPEKSQSGLSMRVTGDYDAGRIFHYHPLRRDTTWHGPQFGYSFLTDFRSLLFQLCCIKKGRFHNVEEANIVKHAGHAGSWDVFEHL